MNTTVKIRMPELLDREVADTLNAETVVEALRQLWPTVPALKVEIKAGVIFPGNIVEVTKEAWEKTEDGHTDIRTAEGRVLLEEAR